MTPLNPRRSPTTTAGSSALSEYTAVEQRSAGGSSTAATLLCRFILALLLAAPFKMSVDGAVIEFGPNSIRLNPADLIRNLDRKERRDRESAPPQTQSAKEIGSVGEGTPPSDSSRAGVGEPETPVGPVRSEPPYLFAFMPDGRLRAGAGAGDSESPDPFTKAVRDNLFQARLIGRSAPNSEPIARVMAMRHGTQTFLNSQPAVRLLRMAYGLAPVDLDSLVLWTDPGVFIRGQRQAPNEFEQRRLLASRKPFHARVLEDVRSIRLVRFYATHRIDGAYDFVRGGYSVTRMNADPVAPFAGGRLFIPPTFFPIPEGDAEVMARPEEGAVFVFEYEGDLVSPEFQQQYAGESAGLLCARISKLTVHLLPSARSSVPARWSRSSILLETNIVETADDDTTELPAELQPTEEVEDEVAAEEGIVSDPVLAKKVEVSNPPSATQESLERHLRSVVAQVVEKRGEVQSAFFVGLLTMQRPQEWIAATFRPSFAATAGKAVEDYPVLPQPMITGRFSMCFSALKDFAAYRSNSLAFHRLSGSDETGANPITRQECARLAELLASMPIIHRDARLLVGGFHHLVGEMSHSAPVFLVTGSVPSTGKRYFLGVYALAPEGWRMMPFLSWTGVAKQKKDAEEGRLW